MLRKVLLIGVAFGCSFGVTAQDVDLLTNETIVKMVQSGVPNTTIIQTIANAKRVEFRFLPYDLQMFAYYKVSDDVFKAMAAKDMGKPIPGVTPAKNSPIPQVARTAQSPPAVTAAPIPKTPAAGLTVSSAAATPSPRPIVTPVPTLVPTPSAEKTVTPTLIVKEAASAPKTGKTVKIHGYVTAVRSANDFEIEDYRITKDSSVLLELEKSDDPDEKSTFDASEIHIGTEMEIKGQLNQATNQLTATFIKINLSERLHLKRTALMESRPDIKRVGSAWEGQLHVDGQRVVINESTAVTIKPNNSQAKAAKAAVKASKKPNHPLKGSESNVEEEEEPGVALDRIDQIRENTFVSYQGTREKDGTILAKKVEFTQNELTSGEARLWKALAPKVKESNYSTGKPGELRIQTQRFKLVPNEEVQKYVSDLGTSLIPKFQHDLPAGDPQKIPFKFFVVDQKVPNASASPNGTVIVHSGIITAMENEAQLVAVLSHEISHATEEHTYRQSQFHKKVRMAIAIGGAVGAAYGGRAVADLTNLTLAAIRNGYQRSLENQADRVGMEYMVNAGYDPREAPRVWKVMAVKFGDHPTNFFWSDHDNDTTRRSYLMAELKNNYADADFTSYKRNSDRFTATVNALNGLYATKGRKSRIATLQ